MREICGSFFLSVSSRYKKSHQMIFQKEVLGEKSIIWVEYGNVFTQTMMFSLWKVDDLRARELEREEDWTTYYVFWVCLKNCVHSKQIRQTAGLGISFSFWHQNICKFTNVHWASFAWQLFSLYFSWCRKKKVITASSMVWSSKMFSISVSRFTQRSQVNPLGSLSKNSIWILHINSIFNSICSCF